MSSLVGFDEARPGSSYPGLAELTELYRFLGHMDFGDS